MLISVIMPTFNSENYIREAIGSLNKQTRKDVFELIVADGMSTDDTLPLLKSLSNFELKICHGPDLNMYDGINKAIKISSGRFLMFLNSDDCIYSNTVMSELSDILSTQNLKECLCTDICKVSFDRKHEKIYRFLPITHNLLLASKHSTFLPHPGLIISRTNFNSVGMFDTSLGPAADYDFILRVLKKCAVRRAPIISHIFNRRMNSLSIN